MTSTKVLRTDSDLLSLQLLSLQLLDGWSRADGPNGAQGTNFLNMRLRLGIFCRGKAWTTASLQGVEVNPNPANECQRAFSAFKRCALPLYH
jgi:hypothetical protein